MIHVKRSWIVRISRKRVVKMKPIPNDVDGAVEPGTRISPSPLPPFPFPEGGRNPLPVLHKSVVHFQAQTMRSGLAFSPSGRTLSLPSHPRRKLVTVSVIENELLGIENEGVKKARIF